MSGRSGWLPGGNSSYDEDGMSDAILDDANATPMRPEPGKDAPWYRTDRDLGVIGLNLLRSVMHILTPAADGTALQAGNDRLGITDADCSEAADVLGRSVKEWYRLTAGDYVNATPYGTGIPVQAMHKTYDEAMTAGGWYTLPKSTRYMLHSALGEVMLPLIFASLRSNTRIGENVPTDAQLYEFLKKIQIRERQNQWSIRHWLRCCGRFVRRHTASWSTSKPPVSE